MADEKKTVTTAKDVPAKKAVKKQNGFVRFGKRIAKWFREMRSELRKVIWPTPKQILNNTLVALTVMVISAIGIWGFDQIASMGVQLLIKFGS